MATIVRAAGLIGFVDLAREIGLDPFRLLDRVGIPRAALDDPDMWISATALRDLHETCGQTAEDWCLRLMSRRPLSTLGPVLLVGREQPTVRSALVQAGRMMSVHHDAVFLEVDEMDDVAIVRIVLRYESPGPSRQVAEGCVYQALSYVRLFLGRGWAPLSVSFMHAPPVVLDTHRRAFGAVILFDQDFNGIVLDRAALDAKNASADPEVARLVARYAEGLPRREAAADVAGRVRQVIEDLLRTGDCNISVVAQQMRLDTRTLQRSLANSGNSFKDILQAARVDLARVFLEESNRPLAEISELLGFSAVSAFSRWHSTHCGQSPSERRDATRLRMA